MIRTDILLLSGMLALAVGCGDDSTAAVPDMKTLPVPDVAVAVSDRTATVRWSISEPVEAVRFTFELYAGDAAAPLQSATTRLQSQRFEMEPGVSYRFRVLAAAPLGSAGWQDSAFSDFATFSTQSLFFLLPLLMEEVKYHVYQYNKETDFDLKIDEIHPTLDYTSHQFLIK